MTRTGRNDRFSVNVLDGAVVSSAYVVTTMISTWRLQRVDLFGVARWATGGRWVGGGSLQFTRQRLHRSVVRAILYSRGFAGLKLLGTLYKYPVHLMALLLPAAIQETAYIRLTTRLRPRTGP